MIEGVRRSRIRQRGDGSFRRCFSIGNCFDLRRVVDAGQGVDCAVRIARFLDVKPSTVTTVMDGLVAEGIVVRVRGTNDRRRVDYELTDSGRETLGEANTAAVQALSTPAANIESKDRDAAYGGLDLWTQAIDARRKSHWGKKERA